MKKNILLAVVGVAALTGCTSNEVMKERGFVPAPRDDQEVTAAAPDKTGGSAPASSDAPGSRSAAPERSRRPRGSEFPPMTGDFGGGKGISGDTGAAAASGEYIVKRGDTLGRIAAAHRVKLSALMKANNLTEKDAKRLQVGKKLVIPDGKAVVRSAKADKKDGKTFGAKGGGSSIRPGEYIVKAGDTPERIARRAGVRLSALMDANNLTEKEARRLRIGQKLVIPEKGAKAVAKADKPVEKPAAKEAEAADKLTGEMNKAEMKDAPAPAAVPAAEAAPAIPETSTAPAAAEESEVVVVPADISLADFAREHNTTPEALRKLNSDLKGDNLSKDALLLVPKK